MAEAEKCDILLLHARDRKKEAVRSSKHTFDNSRCFVLAHRHARPALHLPRGGLFSRRRRSGRPRCRRSLGAAEAVGTPFQLGGLDGCPVLVSRAGPFLRKLCNLTSPAHFCTCAALPTPGTPAAAARGATPCLSPCGLQKSSQRPSCRRKRSPPCARPYGPCRLRSGGSAGTCRRAKFRTVLADELFKPWNVIRAITTSGTSSLPRDRNLLTLPPQIIFWRGATCASSALSA